MLQPLGQGRAEWAEHRGLGRLLLVKHNPQPHRPLINNPQPHRPLVNNPQPHRPLVSKLRPLHLAVAPLHRLALAPPLQPQPPPSQTAVVWDCLEVRGQLLAKHHVMISSHTRPTISPRHSAPAAAAQHLWLHCVWWWAAQGCCPTCWWHPRLWDPYAAGHPHHPGRGVFSGWTTHACLPLYATPPADAIGHRSWAASCCGVGGERADGGSRHQGCSSVERA